MTATTSYSVGTVVAAEAAVEIRPKYVTNPAKPGVLYVHGAGSDATYCIVPTASQSTLTNKITREGYLGFSGDNGGAATWGNPTSITRLTTAKTHLQTTMGASSSGVVLVSGSMGGLNSLAWAAANPTLVSCIVSVIPVINVTDIVTNNRGGYAASINAAYSGGWSEATYGATHNPSTLAATGVFDNIPMLLFYGLTDTLCLPEHTEAFAATVGSNVELVPINDGHTFTTYDLVNHDQAVAFIKAHT